MGKYFQAKTGMKGINFRQPINDCFLPYVGLDLPACIGRDLLHGHHYRAVLGGLRYIVSLDLINGEFDAFWVGLAHWVLQAWCEPGLLRERPIQIPVGTN